MAPGWMVICLLLFISSSSAAPTILTLEVSQEEQCDVIMAAFEDFEAHVVESDGDAYSRHLMDSLIDNLGLRVGSQKKHHSLRHYLCQYVGVNSMSRLASVHGMSQHEMKNYYSLIRNYWFFMRSELEESLNSNLTAVGRETLAAYLVVLREIERTGFLDIPQ